MSTTSLIDRMFTYAGGFSRTGTRSILHLIQEGQDKLLIRNSEFQRFISTDNKGWPPYLYTTAGTYRYNIASPNLSCTLTKTIGGTAYAVRAKKVNKIFVDTSTDYDYNRTWLGKPYVVGFDNPYRTSNDRVEVANIPIRAEPALENTVAYVDFKEDPGTSTDVYFVDFSWEAPRLDSESIPLCVPEEYEEALEDYVLGRIEKMSNGNTGERLIRFEQFWIPKYASESEDGQFYDQWQVENYF